jgi:hypothetical protein
MMATMDLAQPARRHVRVDLRRRNVGVAEERLDDSEVRSAAEQVRGERMPEHVR